MTKQLPVECAPGPLEGYAARFDDPFRARAQREGFVAISQGFCSGRAQQDPYRAGEHRARGRGAAKGDAESLQRFLSEPGWNAREANGRHPELLLNDSATVPNEKGALVIDEDGDRK